MPWNPPSITVKWGPYSSPDPAEQKAVVETVQLALGAGGTAPLITPRMGVEKLNQDGVFDIDDVDKLLDELEQAKIEQEEKQAEQAQRELDAAITQIDAKARAGGSPPDAPGKPAGPPGNSGRPPSGQNNTRKGSR